MTKLFLFVFLSVSLFSFGQVKPENNTGLEVGQDSLTYIEKCIAFIREINQQKMSDTNFILTDKPFAIEYDGCIANLLSDTATYTKEELTIIRDKKYPLLTRWTKTLFPNTRLISGDTINSIFKDDSKWWPYFNKHIGPDFNTFSVPIFLRNDTYCLFYSDHHCGRLCGSGRLTLYKKEGNKWTVVKTYCNWIS